MDRDHYIDMLYDEVKSQIIISREAYAKSIIDWDFFPVEIDGQEAGVVMTKGHEMHTHVIAPYGIRCARRVLRQSVQAQVDRMGYATTRTLNDPKVVLLLERMGFYKIGECDGILEYRLDEMKIK
jgi:hypothetical protein